MESKQTVGKKRGFTLAEALVLLLITALIIVATMPVITRKKRFKQDYKYGPPGGLIIPKEKMPYTFNPPAKAKNFVFYFNNSLIPSFSTREMGSITLKQPAPRVTREEPTGPPVYIPPSTSTTEGYGKHDSSWDEYKKQGHTIQEEDKTSTSGGYTYQPTKTVVIDEGGCKGAPEFYKSLEEYTKGKVKLSGEYCTDAEMIRIVY